MKTVILAILVSLLGLFLQAAAQTPPQCLLDPTNRPPQISDINVTCNTMCMDLSIYLCPIYNAMYNESLMVLNNQISNSLCYGTADYTVSPPVLRFRFPLNDTALSSCGNIYQIFDQVGSGQWADFSSIQTVNISGMVTAIDPSVGMITYRQQILYKFSCAYPLQYLLNNTQISVSGVSIAMKDNNGSFLSTLSLKLYKDSLYQQLLTIPPTGLNLKTKIYVEVKATNLTSKFNLLLDRCYATTSPLPMQSSYYDLFVGCTRDPQTIVDVNGVAQIAHFNFEAFKFVEQRNQSVSTFYLHCTTRLCDVAKCSSLLPNCNAPAGRRKRAADGAVSDQTTITSPAINVAKEPAGTASDGISTSSASQGNNPLSLMLVWGIVFNGLLSWCCTSAHL